MNGIFCDGEPGEHRREGRAREQGGEHDQHHPGADVGRQEAVHRDRGRVGGEHESGSRPRRAAAPRAGSRTRRAPRAWSGRLQDDAGDDRPGRRSRRACRRACRSSPGPGSRPGRGRRSSSATPPIQRTIRVRRRPSGCERMRAAYLAFAPVGDDSLERAAGWSPLFAPCSTKSRSPATWSRSSITAGWHRAPAGRLPTATSAFGMAVEDRDRAGCGAGDVDAYAVGAERDARGASERVASSACAPGSVERDAAQVRRLLDQRTGGRIAIEDRNAGLGIAGHVDARAVSADRYPLWLSECPA